MKEVLIKQLKEIRTTAKKHYTHYVWNVIHNTIEYLESSK